jgi:SagB-type dehydrogenase family enzyme
LLTDITRLESPDMLVRRSRPLVAYWRDGRLVLYNYLESVQARVQPIFPALLSLCEDWTPLEQFLARAAIFGVTDEAQVRQFAELGLLELCDDERTSNGGLPAMWRHWEPEAAFFHFATRNPPAISDEELESVEAEIRGRGAGRPPAIKAHDDAPNVVLARPTPDDDEFLRVLRERRTWRRFGRKPLTLESLAALLFWTFGIQRWGELDTGGRVPLKTSPSGGACHPLEAYVLCRDVSSLAAGIYHYNAAAHALELVRGDIDTLDSSELLRGQWWYEPAPVIVFMSAVFERTQWRYQFSRAYRAILIEAGHLCQTFCLVATWLGLAPFCTAMFQDSQVERAIGLNGVEEGIVYVAGAGTRSHEGAWRSSDQWPEHAPERRFVRPQGDDQ